MIIQEGFACSDYHYIRDGDKILIVASSWGYGSPAGIFDNDPHFSYGKQWDWGSLQ